MRRSAVIVLLGPPNSGKGTIAAELAERLPGLHYVATGNLIREAIREAGREGAEWQDAIADGRLISSSDVEQLIIRNLRSSATSSDILLDGYPRLPEQAARLPSLVGGGREVSVVYLSVCPSALRRRARSRVQCSICHRTYSGPTTCSCGGPTNRRIDDEPEVLSRRLRAFYRDLPGITANFGDIGRFVSVRGDSTPSGISDTIVESLALSPEGI